MSFILWPFKFVWSLIGLLLELTGRITAGIIGFVFLVTGIILTITVIAAFIGIPLIFLGFFLLIRSIF